MEHDVQLLEAARWIGEHALVAFGIGLAALLLTCVLLWRLLQWWMVRSQASTLPPLVFLLSRLALGFAVLIAGAWVFSEVAEALDAGPALARADQLVADEIGRTVPRQVLAGFSLVTHLGDSLLLTLLCILVAVALLRQGRRGLALGWVVAVAGNAVLNPALKAVFMRVRPVHDTALASASGYSFPSGHTSGSVVAYGMLAYVLVRTLPPRWHMPVVLAASALAFTVGCSRIFLRVHFASDVLAGFASGAAWLAVCVVSIEWTLHVRRRAV